MVLSIIELESLIHFSESVHPKGFYLSYEALKSLIHYSESFHPEQFSLM